MANVIALDVDTLKGSATRIGEDTDEPVVVGYTSFEQNTESLDNYQRHTFVPLLQGHLLCPEQSTPALKVWISKGKL